MYEVCTRFQLLRPSRAKAKTAFPPEYGTVFPPEIVPPESDASDHTDRRPLARDTTDHGPLPHNPKAKSSNDYYANTDVVNFSFHATSDGTN